MISATNPAVNRWVVYKKMEPPITARNKTLESVAGRAQYALAKAMFVRGNCFMKSECLGGHLKPGHAWPFEMRPKAAV
jgi:hypothetical protein